LIDDLLNCRFFLTGSSAAAFPGSRKNLLLLTYCK
jgi:hypothetical protein